MWRASRRLISSTSAASVVVLPEPVGPPISTSPRGSCASSSTVGGRPSVARRGTRVRQQPDRRRGAAALAVQVDAEPADAGDAERRVGDARRRDTAAARAAAAPAAPPLRCRRRRAGPPRADAPGRRRGSPAARRRPAAGRCRLRAPSSRSHRSSRVVLPPRTSDADCASTLEFSSTISRSMSSGSCVTAAAAPGSSCSTAAAGHRQGAPRSRRARPA